MDLANVMDEIGDQLDTIDGLRVYRYPPDNVAVPAAVVAYPEDYEFDSTYARGMDRITNLPVVVMVGKVSDRASRDRISAYANGAGAKSVKAVIESGIYTAFDTVRVQMVEFDIVQMANVEYLAATFSLDIAGQGSEVQMALPGGIEIDYAERVGNYVHAGNALAAFPIPDTVVTVPDTARPVYLTGQAILVPSVPSTGLTMELAIGVAGEVLIPLNQVLAAAHGPGLAAGDGISVWVRLPPNSPGSYQLYATITSGDNVTVLSPSHATAKLAAIAYTGSGA
jgi:hypothetical protein